MTELANVELHKKTVLVLVGGGGGHMFIQSTNEPLNEAYTG